MATITVVVETEDDDGRKYRHHHRHRHHEGDDGNDDGTVVWIPVASFSVVEDQDAAETRRPWTELL